MHNIIIILHSIITISDRQSRHFISSSRQIPSDNKSKSTDQHLDWILSHKMLCDYFKKKK